MDLRRRKQFIALAVFLVPPFLAVGAIFGPRLVAQLLRMPPAPADEPIIELLWAGAFPGEQEPGAPYALYDVASRIRNRSETKGVRRFEYRFELLGVNEEVLVTRLGAGYIRSGEAKYIVENSLASPEPPARVRFSTGETLAVADDGAEPSPVGVLAREYGQGALTGRALNKAVVGLDKVEVAAVLFDAEGKALRARATHFSRFLAGEERGFLLRWANPGPVATYEVEVMTNVLDHSNYLPAERSPVR